MERLLIVSNTGMTLTIISKLLQARPDIGFSTVSNGNACRRCLVEEEFDVVIIDSPLGDESGWDLAAYVCEVASCGVMLLSEEIDFGMESRNLEEEGVFILPKPISPEVFYQGFRLLTALKRRLIKLEQENLRLQRSMEEARIVGKAKCLLVQHKGITEQQAHRLIEKEAMDRRRSKFDIAQEFILLYD